MPVVTSRHPGHGTSFVLKGVHVALSQGTDLAVGNTSCSGLESVIPDGGRGGSCFHYFLSQATDGTDRLIRNFLVWPACTILLSLFSMSLHIACTSAPCPSFTLSPISSASVGKEAPEEKNKSAQLWRKGGHNLGYHKWMQEMRHSHRTCNLDQHSFNHVERKRRHHSCHLVQERVQEEKSVKNTPH